MLAGRGYPLVNELKPPAEEAAESALEVQISVGGRPSKFNFATRIVTDFFGRFVVVIFVWRKVCVFERRF